MSAGSLREALLFAATWCGEYEAGEDDPENAELAAQAVEWLMAEVARRDRARAIASAARRHPGRTRQEIGAAVDAVMAASR